MRKETLYDILDERDYRMYKNFAYDKQCDMYYDPESNEMIRGDQIEERMWMVIESGNYVECCREVGVSHA